MRRQKGAQPGTGAKLVLAIVTCVNLALTLALAVMRRQDTVKAIREDGKLLLEEHESAVKKE